jgi:hypothetical protein
LKAMDTTAGTALPKSSYTCGHMGITLDPVEISENAFRMFKTLLGALRPWVDTTTNALGGGHTRRSFKVR